MDNQSDTLDAEELSDVREDDQTVVCVETEPERSLVLENDHLKEAEIIPCPSHFEPSVELGEGEDTMTARINDDEMYRRAKDAHYADSTESSCDSACGSTTPSLNSDTGLQPRANSSNETPHQQVFTESVERSSKTVLTYMLQFRTILSCCLVLN